MQNPLLPKFMFALREDIKDLSEFLPRQGEPLATGYDVRAAQPDRKDLVIRPGTYVKIPLGFRMFCPEGWWVQLNPRSSTFAKKNIHGLYGVIDEGYENELVFAGQYLPDPTWITGSPDLVIKFGDAIGQLIPVERKIMEVESITNVQFDAWCRARGALRGTGGFGSTG